jgi:hypothetical protein
MAFPFSRAEFFAVFARYNDAVWPAQFALYALAIAAVILALRRSSGASRAAFVILALLWLWMGVVYHAGFFAEVNPAAIGFSAVFLVQALLLFYLATQKNVVIAPHNAAAGWAGASLVILGLLVYPMMSIAAGHEYPAQPTFGLPCPTTIFTLGILVWAIDTAPRRVFVIPVLWSLIGTVGALQLGVPEDFSLALSVAVVAVVAFVTLARKAATSDDREPKRVLLGRM